MIGLTQMYLERTEITVKHILKISNTRPSSFFYLILLVLSREITKQFSTNLFRFASLFLYLYHRTTYYRTNENLL